MMPQITLQELLTQIDAAQRRMSARNSHRDLLGYCAQVMIQQAAQLQTALTPPDLAAVEPSTSEDAHGPDQAKA